MERERNTDRKLVKLNFRCVLVLCLSLGGGCAIGQSQGQNSQPWIKLTTPKFELYTDASSAKATELLSLLEAADSTALRRVDTGPLEPGKPLRIIAFSNDTEYAPFRLKTAAVGHYLHTRERDYIVLADAEPEHYEAAVHEFTHYAVNRAGLRLPLWLNEGIADLYSTTAARTGTPLLGAPLPGRLSTLANNRLINLRDIFAVERASSLYNDAQRTPVFYAESWALTRLLALDARYAARFPDFLAQVSGGRSSADALSAIYGATPEQLETELPAYIREMQGGRPVGGTAAAGDLSKPKQTTVSEFEQRMIWADLLAAHHSTAARAKDLLLELEKNYPGQPEVQELLGHIAWTAKHLEEAQVHWAKAITLGSLDFETLYRMALLIHSSGAPSPQVISLMEKAIQAKPDCDEAVYNLGVLKYDEGQYRDAAEILLRLQNVTPEQAYTYYSVLGYCQMKMKTFDRAKAFLLKATESARTAEEQAENSRMLQFAAARAD